MDNTILQLKAFVRQRLSAVSRDIMAEVERNMMLAQRESEISQPKETAENLPHRESLPEKPVEEPPQISFTVDHGDNYDAPHLQQKNQVSSAPEESNSSQSSDIPRPPQTPADGNDHISWNCLLTDFTSDMKKGQEKQKKEDGKLDEIVFPSVQFLKDDDLSLASESPGSQNTEKQKRTPVQCPVCGKSYAFRSFLTSHMRTHLPETDCKVCGKKRKSVSALVKHVRLKHQKMFCCDICGRMFKAGSYYVMHRRSHDQNDENN